MSVNLPNRPNIIGNLSFEEIPPNLQVSVEKQFPVEMSVNPVVQLGDDQNVTKGIHDALLEKGIDMTNPEHMKRISDVKYEFKEETVNGVTGVVAEPYKASVKERVYNEYTDKMEMQNVDRTALKFTATFTIKYKDEAGTEQTLFVRTPIKTIEKQPSGLVHHSAQDWHNYISRMSAEVICRTYVAALVVSDPKHKSVHVRINDLLKNNITNVKHHPDPKLVLRPDVRMGETSFHQEISLADANGKEKHLIFHEPWLETYAADGSISRPRDAVLDRRFVSVSDTLKLKPIVRNDEGSQKFDELEKITDKTDFTKKWNEYRDISANNPTYKDLKGEEYLKRKEKEIDELKDKFKETLSGFEVKMNSYPRLSMITPNFILDYFFKQRVQEFNEKLAAFEADPTNNILGMDIRKELLSLNDLHSDAKELEKVILDISQKKDQLKALAENPDNKIDASKIDQMNKSIEELQSQIERFKPLLDLDLRTLNHNFGLGHLNTTL